MYEGSGASRSNRWRRDEHALAPAPAPATALASFTDDEEDESDGQTSRYQCVDCNLCSPKTNTPHTLISSRHGWRLTRTPNGSGGHSVQWRCPSCWAAHKIRMP